MQLAAVPVAPTRASYTSAAAALYDGARYARVACNRCRTTPEQMRSARQAGVLALDAATQAVELLTRDAATVDPAAITHAKQGAVSLAAALQLTDEWLRTGDPADYLPVLRTTLVYSSASRALEHAYVLVSRAGERAA